VSRLYLRYPTHQKSCCDDLGAGSNVPQETPSSQRAKYLPHELYQSSVIRLQSVGVNATAHSATKISTVSAMCPNSQRVRSSSQFTGILVQLLVTTLVGSTRMNPDPPDETASGQLRTPILIGESKSYDGSGGGVPTDPTGERRNRQFAQHFRSLRSCLSNLSEESGLKKVMSDAAIARQAIAGRMNR
jgi:hypothetical protein